MPVSGILKTNRACTQSSTNPGNAVSIMKKVAILTPQIKSAVICRAVEILSSELRRLMMERYIFMVIYHEKIHVCSRTSLTAQSVRLGAKWQPNFQGGRLS